MNKLNKCSVCGRTGTYFAAGRLLESSLWMVMCMNCEDMAQTKWCESKKEAEDIWNKEICVDE